MILKNCVICGKEFIKINKGKTCCEACSKELHLRLTRKYYFEHSEKWKWYKANKKVEPLGTTDLVDRPKRKKNGKIDFGHEANLIARELRRIGLE